MSETETQTSEVSLLFSRHCLLGSVFSLGSVLNSKEVGLHGRKNECSWFCVVDLRVRVRVRVRVKVRVGV